MDSERIIELYKSGAVASVDTLRQALVDTNQLKPTNNTIKKSKSFNKIPSDKECQSAYQSKRKLEQRIESLEEEISKGKKFLMTIIQIGLIKGFFSTLHISFQTRRDNLSRK